MKKEVEVQNLGKIITDKPILILMEPYYRIAQCSTPILSSFPEIRWMCSAVSTQYMNVTDRQTELPWHYALANNVSR